MSQRPATVLDPAKIALLRKALMVRPMSLPLVGLSMFPAIRAGDLSVVEAVDPDTLQVGDIILATRDDRLYAHRLVAIDDGPPARWIAKGDTLLLPDPPVPRENILGQVVALQRGRRKVDLRSPWRRRIGAAMAAASGPYSRAFARAVLLRRRLLAGLAAVPAWRARRRARTHNVTVRPVTPDDLEAVAMMIGETRALVTPMERIDMEALREDVRRMMRQAESASATFWVAEHEGFLSGHAVVGPLWDDLATVPGWWVMNVYVKMTARGRGLAERLVRAGLEDARQQGVPEVRYAAYESNAASLKLARKLGFRPDDSEVARRFASRYEGRQPGGARLIVLKISL